MRFDIICRWLSILTDLANDFVMSRELKFLFYSRLNFCIYFFIFFVPLLNVDLLSIIIIITKLIINRTKSVTLIHPMHKTTHITFQNQYAWCWNFLIYSIFQASYNLLTHYFKFSIKHNNFIYIKWIFSYIYIIFTISSSTNPLNTVISDSSISGVI